MLKTVGKWLNIHEEEISLFLWTALLLFLIRTSSILFNNFAETAFLKRFGVEYLPIVYVANSISTFVIMGFMTGIMTRLPGSRLLSYMLMYCGISVAALRFVVPLGFDLIYPVLFVLKSQYEVLLALVFWNLANDLFNTRQSKRLFPLITAGGVVGGIIGSFATPSLAKAISMDNLMFAYLVTTMLGAVAVNRMGKKFPTLLLPDRKEKKVKKRSNIIQEFKKILPLMKESDLVKVLILLTLLPNIVIPIINYQFNFAVNETYATQGGMLAFFGYFRGCMNIVSLIILLFIGRVYGRWGLPVVLMFHPFNYMIAFLALLLKFDIVSAMYARVSTNVLRTTMNNPARAILMGLFPVSYRGVIRPFLRGTVVRIGVLLGAGIIMISEGLFPPRYLSIAAMFFVGGWILTSFFLKRSYSKILLDLISRNMLDLKSLEEQDINQVFKDKKMQAQLVESFLAARGNESIWYVDLLKSQELEDLDSQILKAVKENDDDTKIALLSRLSPDAGQAAVKVLKELADLDKPDLTIAVLQAANRLPSGSSASLNREIFESAQNPEVKAYALIGLFRQSPQEYRETIDGWLASGDASERRAGVTAAGESGEVSYVKKLREILEQEEDGFVLSLILTALSRLGAEDINTLVIPHLSHPLESVRLAALKALEIDGDDAIRIAISTMDDPSEKVHDLAKDRLQAAPYQNAQLLIESLNIPRRKVRDGLFALLESLDIKDVDVFRFARSQMERCYNYLAESEGLRSMPESEERDLLIAHLENKKHMELENVLRVLATEDSSGQMRAIWRGIFSANARRRANSLEALDDSIDASLSRIILPLLEESAPSETLRFGRKNFQLPDFDSDKSALCSHFLSKKDWVTVVLTLYLLAKQGLDGVNKGIVKEHIESDNPYIRQMARRVMEMQSGDSAQTEEDMETEMSIPDKILRLKGIEIFEGLAVGELAAVASVTEEAVYPPGDFVIKEGEAGDTMYLVVKGKVSVLKGQEGEEGGREIELDRIGAGGYFGEMALFEDVVRSASIRTEEESNLLVLHKQEFTEIVREYPQIALHICKELSGRIRHLHEKVKSYEK
ncbi:MAG: cyclic nucleotide-binding domain-containing protein [Desulfobacteraceae bacterium]|nr:cyclic nucleotide-binding domain-containing protein [Desulfobacteraceae bacterium]